MGVLGDMNDKTPITAIIQGGASGADMLGRCFADMYKIKCITVPADWEKNGRAAGPIRNKRMLTDFKPDIVVAFPGGVGTANMVRQAKAVGVKIVKCSTSDAAVSPK